MKAKNIWMAGVAAVTLLTGCASQHVAIAPVGPAPESRAAAKAGGYLMVYSATMARPLGDVTWYYTHTRYNIYDPSGKWVETVPNHLGDMDEFPSRVALPAGSYKIVAQSVSYGCVTVPVVVQSFRTTVVHLDRDWRPAKSAPNQRLVRLPDGEAIGWSVSMTNSVARNSE